MVLVDRTPGYIKKTYIKHSDKTLWDFDTVINDTFLNINHIHPLKQADTLLLIRELSQDQHVIGIIIFGSAVRFNCHSGSDLDVLIIRDDDQLTLSGNIGSIQSELDIIFSSKIGERLQEEIAQTGVVVFERGD